MSRFLFGPHVESDLRGIRDYIAADSPEAAVYLMERFVHAFRLLAGNPKLGHTRKDLTIGPRFWPVENYLIVYFADRKPIEIIAVMHASRDVPTLLRDRM